MWNQASANYINVTFHLYTNLYKHFHFDQLCMSYSIKWYMGKNNLGCKTKRFSITYDINPEHFFGNRKVRFKYDVQ